jgi:hypothetical protein
MGGKPVQYWLHQLPLARITFVGGTEKAVVLQSVGFTKWEAHYWSAGQLYQAANAKPVVGWDGKAQPTPEASAQAVCAIGTNGIGFYMRRLRGQSSPILHWIQQGASRCGVNRFVFGDVEIERQQAATALILLKPLPESTAKELLELSKQGNRAVASAAWCVLDAEWPGKRPVFDKIMISYGGRYVRETSFVREASQSYREHTTWDSNIWSPNFSLTSGP